MNELTSQNLHHVLASYIRSQSLIVTFMLIMVIFLIIPLLCTRLKIPGIAGLIICGIVLGPEFGDVFRGDSPLLKLFAELGKLLILFYAGLEIDLSLFKARWKSSVLFGILTCCLPLAGGISVAMYFGYSPVASVLIGSLIASHTLIAYPIVQKAGLSSSPHVAVTVGATIITDMAALFILAICVPIHKSGLDSSAILMQSGWIILYMIFVVVGIPKIIGSITEHYGKGKNAEFEIMSMFVIVISCALLAELIHLEAIVGAFLSGIAVNIAVNGEKTKEHIAVLGNVLFVPAFFFMIGINIHMESVFAALFMHPFFVAAMISALVSGKFIAAWLAGWIGHYGIPERMNMFSLSLPQVAATLAAAIVAYDTIDKAGVRLIDESVVSTILVLMLLTSITGPLLTGFYTAKIKAVGGNADIRAS